MNPFEVADADHLTVIIEGYSTSEIYLLNIKGTEINKTLQVFKK